MVIQDVFEKHIVHAPGMEKIRDMVTGPILPTPWCGDAFVSTTV